MEAAAQLILLDQPVFSPMISLRLRVLAQKEVERARRENIYPMAPTHPPRVLERSTSAPSWDMEVPQEWADRVFDVLDDELKSIFVEFHKLG